MSIGLSQKLWGRLTACPVTAGRKSTSLQPYAAARILHAQRIFFLKFVPEKVLQVGVEEDNLEGLIVL